MFKMGCRIIIALGLLMFTGPVISAEPQTNQSDPSDLYTKTINDLILKCENKVAYRHSRSKEMRRVAALSVMKSAYLREYKVQLIKEMKLKKIDQVDYKVRYFINNQFFKILRKAKSRTSTHLATITN